MRFLSWLLADLVATLSNEIGGGSPPQPAQVIQAPPAPSVSQTAEESLKSQLAYNPQLTQQQYELQQQYGPLFAQNQLATTQQLAPQYQQLLYSMYPELQRYQTQVNQRIASPTGYSPDQQASLDAIRNRELQRGLQGIREGANLGGTLYSGNRQQAEQDYATRLAQGYSAQDIGFQQAQQAANQQALVTLLQLTNPNVQQPAVPQFGQSVVPGGDSLYNALIQNQGNFGVINPQPRQPGFLENFAVNLFS